MIDFYARTDGIGYTSTKKIDHTVFTFPAGESSIELYPGGRQWDSPLHQIAYVRGATGDDIMALAMWNDALRRQYPQDKRTVLLPYLPGARADRDAPLGAKVYADLINGMSFDQVVCVDPHSDVAPALYDNLIRINLEKLPFWQTIKGKYDGVIVPDIGAVKRAEAVAAVLDVPTYQALKHRDFKTGKLSGFTAPKVPTAGEYLVVDDICDGGGTFLGLADAFEVANDLDSQAHLNLWTTHGIYSNNAIPRLKTSFNELFTTDSLAFPHEVVTEVSLSSTMLDYIR